MNPPLPGARPLLQSRGFWLVASAWLLLNIGLLWLYYEPAQKQLVGDEFDYEQRALALLSGQPVAELFIWPPGQTWFIAAIYRVFGNHVLVVQMLQVVLLALCTGMLMQLWRTLDTPRAADFAAAIFLLNPATLAYAYWLWPEVTHLTCLLGALTLLFAAKSTLTLRALAAGVLVGLALLFKSLLAAFWPLLLLCFLKRVDARWKFAWLAAFAFLVGMVLPTAPALWKGMAEAGRPMIADSSIYNLQVGLRDRSRSDYIDEAGLPALTAFIQSGATPQQRNAAAMQDIRASLSERGWKEVFLEQAGTQYFRLFNAKTLLESQLQGEACSGHLGAYGSNPLSPAFAASSRIAHSLTLILFACGLAFWRHWRKPLAALIGIFLAYQLALYLGLHVMERYLFQMLPFLCGFAGSALARFTSRTEDSSTLTITPVRASAAAGLVLLLLGLAWLGPMLDGNCR